MESPSEALSPSDLHSNLLRLMVDASASVNRAGSVERALREVARSVCERTRWEVCGILRQAPEGDLEPLRTGDPAEAARTLALQIGEGPLRDVLDRAEPVWLETLPPPDPSVRVEPFRSALLLPIQTEERAFGLLALGSRQGQPARPLEVETEVLVNVTALLGLLLERRSLELQIAHVTEEERRSIGSELHDVLGQELTGLAMLAGALQRELEREGRSEAAKAGQMLEIVHSAQRNLRALLRGLVPVVVDASGLMAALAELARETSAVHDLDCRFRSSTTLELDDNLVATHLYRIALEAVHNAVRHADAERIDVSLEAGGGCLTLSIQDDGRGFSGSEPRAQVAIGSESGGMGLRILRHRAGLLDAELSIDSTPGGGTTVTCEVPLPETPPSMSPSSGSDFPHPSS